MLRSVASRPILAIAVATVWVAAMLGFAISKEVPVGSLSGRIMGADTGKPIKGASVWLNRVEGKNVVDSFNKETDKNGKFSLTNIPAGKYTVEASARVHSLPKANITIEEGRVEKLDLELKPGPPYLNMYVNQQTYTSKETPSVVLDGFTKSSDVIVKLHRIDLDKLMSGKAGAAEEIILSGGGEEKSFAPNDPSIASTKIRLVGITKRDSEGIYHQSVSLKDMPLGVYILTAQANGLSRTTWLSVTDLSLVTKESGSELLTYAVHPDTGDPLPGAEIKIFEDEKPVASGISGSDGLWKTAFTTVEGAQPNRLIMARSGDSITFVNSYSYEEASSPYTIYAYTDRPVYRPGHTVHFKGIVRKFEGDSYHTPQDGQAQVEVKDRRDAVIYSGQLPLSKFGSFNGSFKLPEYAATGEYTISCNYSGRTETATFSVAEYSKPEFEVSVEMPKKRCTRGERIKAKVRATYFFGAPVVGAEVHYTVSHSQYWFSPDEEDSDGEYEGGYEDYGGYGESTEEGTVRTGPDGTAEVEFTAYWKQPEDRFDDTDEQFTVSADVTDASGRNSTAEGSIIGTQGDLKLSINPREYVVNPGQTADFDVLLTDYDGHPQRNVEVELSANRTDWTENQERYTQVASGRVTTDNAGRATYSFKPSKEGSYVVRATCIDHQGSTIRAAGSTWVPGNGEFEGYNYPDLQIVLDKKTYDPGDTAKVLINSGKVGETALLTIEGRRLYDYRVIKLTNRTTVVEIPIKPEYKPNFYVGVCYVKDKKFINQEARARVSLKQETLKVTVTPNKPKYEPGEQATYLVKTVDSHGHPVQAEVSLGVVDEALYAVQEDSTTPINKFFYSRQNNRVTTRYSFPEVYLSGDKAGFTGDIRKNFVDTAYWKADLVTDANGEARATIKLPDNLTAWRATARACTADTAVGQCKSTMVVTKNLLVRLETPRFLVQSDECVISAIVHNYLPSTQRVRVALKAPGLKIRDSVEQVVTIESQGMQKVDWRISAPNPENTTITAYAVAPQAQDAMQLTIPVKPHGQRLVSDTTGVLVGKSTTERLVVRSDAVPGASEIRIRLAPSLASSMLGSLDYLAEYPYGCTEQTMSTFLPDVVIWRTMKTLNIDNPSLQKQLPDMVGKGLNRLYDAQNENGGWGWCQYANEDLWMTSYVVYGLLTARSAGFQVDQEVLNNGISAMERMLDDAPANSNQFYAIYVLSLTDRTDNAKAQLKSIPKSKIIDSDGLALTAMALANTGQTEPAKKYLAKLWNKAIVTPGDIHWADNDEWYGPPSESTALALMAVVQITPDDARIPRVIQWLMAQRNYNHWNSTRDTATILYALSDYLKQSKELQPDFTARILQNGREVGNIKFDKSSVFQPEKEIVIRPKDVANGDNTIRIEKTGSGTLYYTTELIQYVNPSGTSKPVTGSGITVTREYHKMVSQWDENRRSNTLQPSKSAQTDFEIGDVIEVRITVNSPRAYNRLLIEDYLPAGCEAADRGRLEPWEWTYWYSDQDIRDERVSFYVDTLPKGKKVLEYQVRATTQGTFCALPTLVQAMYQPSITASGVETTVNISR